MVGTRRTDHIWVLLRPSLIPGSQDARTEPIAVRKGVEVVANGIDLMVVGVAVFASERSAAGWGAFEKVLIPWRERFGKGQFREEGDCAEEEGGEAHGGVYVGLTLNSST